MCISCWRSCHFATCVNYGASPPSEPKSAGLTLSEFQSGYGGRPRRRGDSVSVEELSRHEGACATCADHRALGLTRGGGTLARRSAGGPLASADTLGPLSARSGVADVDGFLDAARRVGSRRVRRSGAGWSRSCSLKNALAISLRNRPIARCRFCADDRGALERFHCVGTQDQPQIAGEPHRHHLFEAWP